MDIEQEEWRDVVGYEDAFQVSNLGRVRSKRRVLQFSDKKPDRVHLGRILKTQIDKWGYERVRVSYHDTKITFKVHRLVAQAFLQNQRSKPQVNHVNGVKSDNRVTNLEWSTNGENQVHARRMGLNPQKVGDQASRFEGAVKVYDEKGTHVQTLYGNIDMKSKGFDFRLVSACLRGKRKSHRGCTFEKVS